jgi:VCBS repeat-containing protein
MQLEPRIMFDGAAPASVDHHDSSAPASDGAATSGAGAADHAADNGATTTPAATAPNQTNAPGPSDAKTAPTEVGHAEPVTTPTAHEVIFVDSRVPDLQTLINGAAPGVDVHVLDADRDGVQQIADYLTAHHLTGLSGIQIVSHGSEGALQLGSTALNGSNLADHAAALAGIGAALSADGDIALYGCNVASGTAGVQFLAALSQHTGADVAASTDMTGAGAFGGDWTLERSTGAIETGAAFTAATQASWNHLLVPLASDDSYVAVGNTLLEVGNATTQTGPQLSTAGSVLDNDTPGDSFTISTYQTTSQRGGTVFMVTTGPDAGSFTYVSAANFTGTDTFAYTLRDDGSDGIAGNADDMTGVGTVTITVSGQVWYVDSTAGPGGTGTSVNPFDSLADVTGASGPDTAGDTIYVRETAGHYNGNMTLLANQALIGSGSALIVRGHTLAAAGAATTLTTTVDATDAITLNSGNIVSGFAIQDTTGAGIFGVSVGTLVINNVSDTGTGKIIDITGAAGNSVSVTLDTATTTSSASEAIRLVGINGSVTATTGAISGANGTDVVVSGGLATVEIGSSIASSAGGAIEVTGRGAGAGAVTFSGTLDVTGGAGISVHDNTAGTITFNNSHKAISSGGNTAVSLVNNNGATVNFTNGGLDIDTVDGTGFLATGGGTISVSGSGNSVTTTGIGRILSWNGVIVSGGVAFDTLQSTGTVADDAIALDNVDGGSFSAGNVAIAATSGAGSDGIAITGGSSTSFTFGTIGQFNVIIINTTGAGVFLSGDNGPVTIRQGVIIQDADGTGRGVEIFGGGSDVTIDADISQNSVGEAVQVTERTGGTVDFNGKITDVAAGGGIDLTNNAGTLRFDGGIRMTTGSSTAFNAVNNSGNLVVSSSAAAPNILLSSGAITLNVIDTNIGAGGLVFQQISAYDGSAIVLSNTGTTAGLTVTGFDNIPYNSGGTIRPGSSPGIVANNTVDLNLTRMWIEFGFAGGISLTNTKNVVLDRIHIGPMSASAISGTEVTNFRLTNSQIVTSGEIVFTNLLGTAVIDRTLVTRNTIVTNTHGTLVLNVTNYDIYGGTFLISLEGTAVLQHDTPLPQGTVVLQHDRPPTANPASGSGAEDQSGRIAITLSGSDPDEGDGIDSFTIATLAAHGLLFADPTGGSALSAGAVMAATGNNATVYFQANADWSGATGFTYTAHDGNQTSAAATASITVAAASDASVTAGDVSGTETDARVTIPLNLSVSVGDADGSETVRFVVVTFTGAPAGMTATSGSLIGSLIGNVLAILPHDVGTASITVPANYAGSFTGSAVATSNEGTSAADVFTVTIAAAGDVSVTAGDVSGTETDAAVNIPLSLNTLINDADGSETLTNVVVTFTGAPAGMTASVGTLVGHGSGSYTLTLTAAQVATASITAPADYSGSFTASAVANSNEGASTADVFTVTVNAAPEAITANDVTATETDAAVNIPLSLSLHSDADRSETPTTVVVTFTGAPAGMTAAVGSLFANGGGSYTLILTAAQVATASVTVPADYAGSFTASAVATGNEGTSAADVFTVTIAAVNDAPVHTVPGAQSVNEDANLTFAGANAIWISDVDVGGGNVTVTLAVNNGVLTLSRTTGLAFGIGDGSADATMAFSGTVANINATLSGLIYRGNANFNGIDTLTLTTNDLGNTGADPGLSGTETSEQAQSTVYINVNAVNDAPVNTAPLALAVNEDTDLVFGGVNGISVADVDATTVEVTLAVINGKLTLSGISGLTFIYGDGVADATMTFTGTKDDVNAALDGLIYRGNLNYNGSDILRLSTSDNGASGSGGAKQDHSVFAISVTPVNDAATVTGDITGSVNEAGGANNSVNNSTADFTATGNLDNTDVDNTPDAFQPTPFPFVQATNYGLYGVSANGGWVYVLDNHNNTVELLDNGQTLTDSFVVLTQDGTAQTVSITIHGRNDAPDIDSGSTISYNANDGGSVVVDPNIRLSDVDSPTMGGATIAITTGRDIGDQLLFANQNGITGSFNAGTGVLTLTGTATLLQYENALKSVRFASTSGNDGPRTVSWRATDGLDNSPPDSTTINVRGVERHHHRSSDAPYDGNRGNGGNFYSSQNGMVTSVSTGERWNGSIGSGYTYINADIRRVGLDGSLLELQMPLAALADALGGDAVQTTATLLDGKALPDWLKFDPQTGILAGKLPANVVASIQPNIVQQTDDNIVTGSTGNGTSSATHGTISVQITSRDAQGNIATTIFTIDLAHKQSWIPGTGDARRHAAIELQRALAGSSVAPMTFMAPALDGIEDTLSAEAGRVGLSQQLDGHGWRAMQAGRMALIASLQQSAAGWR